VTRSWLAGAFPIVAILLVGLALWGAAPADDTPIGPKWWPGPFGSGDQRGAANRLTPTKVQEASRLIRTGRIYSLGRTYEYGMPLPGKRHFSLTIPGSPTGGPDGENRLVYHDDLFSGEIGQIGTQLDGLGHIGVRVGDDDVFYNGFKRSEFGKPYGLEKLGIENVGVFFTRGVLLDVAVLKQVPRLKAGEVITDRDLQSALDAQHVSISEGDVVLIRTGHGTLWMKDNAEYARGEPGIGVAAARWLCARKIVLVGTDTWATEVVPPEDPKRPFAVHPELLVRNGVYNLENLDLDALARDKVYEFAFIFAPLRLKGATGSPGNPIAVR
jgi:kynurenine formamidase